MQEIIRNWLLGHDVSQMPAEYLSWIVLAVAVILLAWISHVVAKRLLVIGVSYFVQRSKTKWDDYLYQRHVFSRLSHLAPGLVIYFTAYLFPPVADSIQRLSIVYMIVAGLAVLNSLLSAVNDIYDTYRIARQKPIKGYIQVVKIFLTIVIGVVALSVLMNREPWLFLSGFGAMTAIILLVFKDTILGLVASIQLSSYDMVRIGDWIEMPKYGADGDVIDVSLLTIKVQNWDKTITTIPAYSLISDSFKNWRGMQESGGRRIKRPVYLDMTSVKFCDEEMLRRFEKYQLITDYIKQKRTEIAEYNKANDIDTSELINGRNLTNLGTFRAYVAAYLHHHPKIHQGLTFLIRHRAPTEKGLPLEIYVFSNDQVWANYEAIQADIFDHILAVVPMFDLRIFQLPSGYDIKTLSSLPAE
jgi:miniconductance mechanosensitive channel